MKRLAAAIGRARAASGWAGGVTLVVAALAGALGALGALGMPSPARAQTVAAPKVLEHFGFFSLGGPGDARPGHPWSSHVFGADEISLYQLDVNAAADIETYGRRGVKAMVSNVLESLMEPAGCTLRRTWGRDVDGWFDESRRAGRLGHVGVFYISDEPYLRYVKGGRCTVAELNAMLSAVARGIRAAWAAHHAAEQRLPPAQRTLATPRPTIAISEPHFALDPRPIGYLDARRDVIAEGIDWVGMQCYPGLVRSVTRRACSQALAAFEAAATFAGAKFFLIPPAFDTNARVVSETDQLATMRHFLDLAASRDHPRVVAVIPFAYEVNGVYDADGVCAVAGFQDGDNERACSTLKKFPALRTMLRDFARRHVPGIGARPPTSGR